MLNALCITALIGWVMGLMIKGITLYSLLLIIPTVLFIARKAQYHCSYPTIIAIEALLLFFSIVWQLLFNKFSLAKVLLVIAIRLIFIGICMYDDLVFVYIQEERKRR